MEGPTVPNPRTHRWRTTPGALIHLPDDIAI
jgi:hypothetical protein